MWRVCISGDKWGLREIIEEFGGGIDAGDEGVVLPEWRTCAFRQGRPLSSIDRTSRRVRMRTGLQLVRFPLFPPVHKPVERGQHQQGQYRRGQDAADDDGRERPLDLGAGAG